MKRLLLFLPLLLLFTVACNRADVEFLVDTALTTVDVGLDVWSASHDNACASGAATPEQCAKWAKLFPKLLETKNTLVLAWDEYRKMKNATNEERLRIALSALTAIVKQIKDLVNAWKPKHVDDILRRLEYRLEPDALEAVLSVLKS